MLNGRSLSAGPTGLTHTRRRGSCRVEKFVFVTPWLAVGSALEDAHDVEEVLGRGVTDIVSCRVSFDDRPLLQGRAGYLWNPAPDDRQPKEARWFLDAIAFVEHARRDPRARVLIHCTGGVDRSPSLAYAVLRAAGWGAADAEARIRAVYPEGRLVYQRDAEEAVRQLEGMDRSEEVSW